MTNWPLLVWIGSLKLLLTTWTDIPGSIRIPLQLERCLVVILNSGIYFYTYFSNSLNVLY